MDDGCWSEQKKKREADETPKPPAILIRTHEDILEMVRSKKIDLSTVKLFAMDEPSSMLEKRSRQITEFAEIKSALPKSVQVAKFINCGKDKRIIQGIDQFYVGIQEEVSAEGEVVQVGKCEDVSAMIEKIFKCDSYYDIFNLPRTAKTSKINKSYRELSRKLHPDKCSAIHSTDVSKLINHARDVLSDSDERRKYDCGDGDFPRPIQFKPKPDSEVYISNSALKLGSLCRLLKCVGEEKRSMIFCDDSDEVNEVSQEMMKEGHTTAVVDSRRSQLARDHELLKFCDGSARFLVTTTLCGRAMTVQRVHLVINYDLPANCVDYGRRLVHFGPLEQREGAVINFITKEAEKKIIRQFEAYYDMKIEGRNLDDVF
uniref:J domain-containing protein n=1 Tax=Ditylenchus dipsaci TaxID=166011 RepID=A0A915D122_9BILA